MPKRQHFHNFETVLKTEIREYIEPAFDDEPCERELATIYKQCSCGCINKTQIVVTHLDGSPWNE